MEVPQKVRGTQDWFGEQQRYYTFIKKVARHIFRHFGFTRISTPVMEMRDLIVRSVGEHTDVVSKELYEFKDKKGRDLVLKPESTAGVMRSYLENFQNDPQPVYLFYIEPHFRYDRPQKGRYRQFHQIGAEIIGERDPVLDAENIHMAVKILSDCGLKGKFTTKINTLGNAKEREAYVAELQAFFRGKSHLLDEIDQARVENNPLRILDSKNPDVREILPFAPKLRDFFKKDSLAYYESTKEYLTILGIDFVEDPTLVRGLDYYSDVVFECVDNSGRSQDSFCGGGRYDDLATSLGSKNTIPAAGFAIGVERLIDAMIESWLSVKNKDTIDLYFIQVGEEAKKLALPLSIQARDMGLNILASFGSPSMKTQLKKANQLKAKYVAIIGIMEARRGVCQLKNMEKGTQKEIKLDELLDHMVEIIGEKNLDFYNPAKELIQGKKPEPTL
jgi:histidyl-tRNA synthetase